MCSRLPVSSRSNRRRCAGKSRRFSGTSRPRELTRLVIAGLDPAIHLSRNLLKTDGWPGLHRAEGQFVLSVACTASAPQAGQARPRREGVQCRRAAPHPGREGAYYFRTQITRTTAALASVEVPAAAISCAFRKSRTVSPVTSTDWLAGAAFVVVAVATTTGLSSATPVNLPASSSAGAPENPTAGGGDSARSPPVPTNVTCALALETAAAPPWFCGSAMPTISTLPFAAPSERLSGFRLRTP